MAFGSVTNLYGVRTAWEEHSRRGKSVREREREGGRQ